LQRKIELIANRSRPLRVAVRKDQRGEKSREDRVGAELGVDDDPPIRACLPTKDQHRALCQIVCSK
jgi:hypothetical protein